MAKFCYLNYDLDSEPRFCLLRERLGLAGVGAFFEVYKEIRKCGGKAPLDYLISHLRKLRYPRPKAQLLLFEFSLFLIDSHATVRLDINLAQPIMHDRRQLSLFPEEEPTSCPTSDSSSYASTSD